MSERTLSWSLLITRRLASSSFLPVTFFSFRIFLPSSLAWVWGHRQSSRGSCSASSGRRTHSSHACLFFLILSRLADAPLDLRALYLSDPQAVGNGGASVSSSHASLFQHAQLAPVAFLSYNSQDAQIELQYERSVAGELTALPCSAISHNWILFVFWIARAKGFAQLFDPLYADPAPRSLAHCPERCASQNPDAAPQKAIIEAKAKAGSRRRGRELGYWRPEENFGTG